MEFNVQRSVHGWFCCNVVVPGLNHVTSQMFHARKVLYMTAYTSYLHTDHGGILALDCVPWLG